MQVLSFIPSRCWVALLVFAGLFSAPALAQTDSSPLPDDPSSTLLSQSGAANSAADSQSPKPAPSDPQNGSLAGKQTKRILGVFPNFRSVSVDVKLPPESVKDKFMEATQDSFDYSDFIFVAALSGVDQLENSYPEFHQGVVGYGRYYWHALSDQVDEDYQTEFVFPTLLRQDPRYYTLGRGGFPKRFVYAFSRIVITRNDAGNETFNSAEVVGAGAAAGVSDLYYPSQERTWTKTGQRWLVNVSLDGATYAIQEFWPDLNSRFFHQKN
jgi:hypothetical protein